MDPNLKTREFRLGWNKLKSLSNISSISSITDLDLERNEIEVIGVNDLKNLRNLKKLDLGYNKISKIEEKAFKNLNSLQWLSLAYNPLTSFNKSLFSDLKNLTHLELTSTQLKEIDYQSLVKELPNLKKLAIMSNKFNCSFAKEMTEYIKEHSKFELVYYLESWGNDDASEFNIDCTDDEEANAERSVKGSPLFIVMVSAVILLGIAGFFVYKKKVYKKFLMRPTEFSNPLNIPEDS